ncbi:MAG: hypothetical protein ACFB11_20870 [Paracoccaceae bacterium]
MNTVHRRTPTKTLARIIACMLAAMFATQTSGDPAKIVSAFEKANALLANARRIISFSIDGCVFKEVIVNPNYCKAFGEGDGDRTITTLIDLREVSAISTINAGDKFHINFDLDFDRPGKISIVMDQLQNGTEGARQRFGEALDAALEAADLRSGTSFSRCDRAPARLKRQAMISVISTTEPDGWRPLIDLAKECRAPASMEFSE